MHLLVPAVLSVLLLLTIGIDLSTSAKMTSSPTSRLSTITTTRTISSPKITRTMTATITTYGLPTHFSYQAKTTTLHTTTSPTPFYINPKTGQLVHNSRPSGKLIGFLFAGGIVLGIFACVAMILGRKRYRKREEKRIRDWVEMSSGHGRYSGASKDGTGILGGGVVAGGAGGVVGEGASGVDMGARGNGGGGCRSVEKGKGMVMGDGDGGVKGEPPAYQVQVPEPAVLRAL